MTRAWVVWIVGLAATTVGVMQRTTFGASGIAAAHRFDVAPTFSPPSCSSRSACTS
jgi:hypothetical protein